MKHVKHPVMREQLICVPKTSNSIDHLMDELKILCDLYIKPGQQRDKKKKATFFLEWQFSAGRSIRAKTTKQGNPTWCHEHNFKNGKGVYLRDVADSTKSPQQKILYAKACELLSLIDSAYAGDHKDFVVNFSCKVHRVAECIHPWG